ncbi:hypothetical protein [Clostridium saccharobutylicum]|uniref:Uncharacterized protein n=1 Tax=Clostridium saccharobutylicum TaxID=169679 RepID=A0A1S8NJB2_CLOSA|nr:hypothetical protein [Clostridium saccharobutylicum]OOM16527.1 hypothetical protein CLOSAC_07980 [Clostridium saccharobutylicum]
MKMKKLLSIGALGLVMACSTSVASFAADTKSLSSDEKAIIVAMAKEYKNGGSILGINKNTTTSSAIGINTNAIKSELENYENGKRLLNHLDLNGTVNDNAHSVVEAIINKCNAANDRDAEFATVKGEIIDVVNDVLAFDKATGTDRADKEAKLKNLLANSEYNVTLGKNSDGATTVSVEKDGTIALQVSIDDAEKIRDILNTLTLADLEDINAGNNILG